MNNRTLFQKEYITQNKIVFSSNYNEFNEPNEIKIHNVDLNTVINSFGHLITTR